MVASVGVANKINELALVEGNLPSSSVMVILCCAPANQYVSICSKNKIQIALLSSVWNTSDKFWQGDSDNFLFMKACNFSY